MLEKLLRIETKCLADIELVLTNLVNTDFVTFAKMQHIKPKYWKSLRKMTDASLTSSRKQLEKTWIQKLMTVYHYGLVIG